MNRLYFFWCGAVLKHFIPRTFSPIISSHHWLDIVKEIGAMHWGRLLSFLCLYGPKQCVSERTICLSQEVIPYVSITLSYYLVDDSSNNESFLANVMEKDKRWMEQVTFVICKITMGSATSRLCASSTPTLALNDICQRMCCLVACGGSQVHVDLRDAPEENEQGNQEEEEEYQPTPESFIRETVL